MQLEELGISKKQIDALEKKKITSVEALLRKPPLRYFDFSKTYPLTLESDETKNFLETKRPFAIYGKCIRYDLSTANHTKMIKLRIEDEATKNHFGSECGNVLFVNIMGYDQFRQSFLGEHPQSPHRIPISVPDGLDAYYSGEQHDVNPACKKQIDFINNLDDYSVKDFVAVKTGGVDGWSKQSVDYIGTPEMKNFLSRYTVKTNDMTNILKWYARGMRLDLAIKKVLLDDDGLLRKLLFDKYLIVGGFISYDEGYQSFSLLNPSVISEDIDKYQTYNVMYGQIKGITPDGYRSLVKKGIEGISSIDFIPPGTCSQFKVPSFKESAEMMHFPKSYFHVKKAQERAIFEDLLYLALKFELQNKSHQGEKGIDFPKYHYMQQYASSLPYDLTKDQKNAVNIIYNKIRHGECVNSLVQGDVGTGKTAVAFCLLLIAASNGYQSALAAPYTTLASQHFRDIKEIADTLGIHAVFLTSDIKGKEKKKVYEEIADGTAQIIIGTHSIFANDVIYKNLALIIQDEEHKFGVVHRENFKDKALPGAHVITMSATPIPKSIAATIYDDTTDIITILEKPANRIPVQTAICKKDETALNFMVKEIKNGHQCYVVCPSIDKNEKADKAIASIEEKESIYREYLERNGAKLAVITGKLKANEKQQIMEDFSSGKVDVLMATTVIEVGINVPNSTVIVITGADRFGFSTLHQLRGRVGRGKDKSYCILQTEEPNEKLQFMCTTTDGFEIAQKDLELRGAGSLFGERQSGDNYYISLMLANQELYQKIKMVAKELCKSGTGKDIVKRYEEIFKAEEER